MKKELLFASYFIKKLTIYFPIKLDFFKIGTVNPMLSILEKEGGQLKSLSPKGKTFPVHHLRRFKKIM